MRKLKLQVQTSVNGFIAGPKGEMDWMVWEWDDRLKDYVSALHEPVDCILLGRKLAEGFVPAWEGRLDHPEEGAFAHKMIDTPKVVFSRTLSASPWPNTTVARGELADAVARVKSARGGDLIAYGGGTFVSELIRHGLIDEYHFFVNPTALDEGMPIFRHGKVPLALVEATQFECGIVVLKYAPAQRKPGSATATAAASTPAS
jgi:dihydrofolate reductase